MVASGLRPRYSEAEAGRGAVRWAPDAAHVSTPFSYERVSAPNIFVAPMSMSDRARCSQHRLDQTRPTLGHRCAEVTRELLRRFSARAAHAERARQRHEVEARVREIEHRQRARPGWRCPG